MDIDSQKKYLMIGLALIVTVVFGMWAFSPTEVVVTGVGRANVSATSATFNISLSSINQNSADALDDLRKKSANIKAVLAENYITADNVTETQITLTPAAAIVVNASGYQATTTLTAKTSNVAIVADTIVKMYGAGAAIVSQPIVVVENQEVLEQEAFKEALKNAKKSLGDTVGPLRLIRKMVGIQQASSGNVATATKTEGANQDVFEVVKAVSVTYRVW
jgi:uncharacterized protein YggE